MFKSSRILIILYQDILELSDPTMELEICLSQLRHCVGCTVSASVHRVVPCATGFLTAVPVGGNCGNAGMYTSYLAPV